MEQELFKGIFQLEVQTEAAFKALSDVNKKYQESNDLYKEQQRELKKLMAQEAELLAGRAKANNPTQAAAYNKKLEETATAINKLKAGMADVNTATKGLQKESISLTNTLKQAFDGTRVAATRNEVEKFNKKLSEGEKPVQSLRAQLRELKAQLATTDDDEEFLRLSIEAGKLQDKIDDAAQAARAFATGSPLQAFGNSLRGVAGDLLSLDFEGAAQKSQLLVKASQQITFKSGLDGIKQLGTTLLNTGKALLSNPLFLLGAAITLIITNFDKLKESGGIVGKTFTFIGEVIGFVIEGFEDLSNAIGLTNTKLEENNRKAISALDEQRKMVIKVFDNRIKLEQAAGRETIKIENERNAFIMKSADEQIKTIRKTAKERGTITKEEQDQISDLYELREEARITDLVRTTEYNKKQADLAKELSRKRKEELEKQMKAEADAVDYNLRIRQAEREARDAANREYLTNEQEANLQAFLKDEELRKQREQDEIDGNALFEKLAAQQDANEEERFKNKQARIEQEKRLEAERLQAQIAGIQTISSAVINAASQQISAEQQKIARLATLQEKRVQDAREIADKGNAEILELEQKRLDDLNRQREDFARRQQQIALIELTANSIVAISKAAAQGGAAAPFTITATLIALTAGLLQARTLAAQQGFYKGGYTGDGDPKQESTALGAKPYTYHKAEFVFNHEKTAKYKDIFQDIHQGNIDLNEWRQKVNAFEAMKFIPMAGPDIDIEALRSELSTIRKAIQDQSTYLNFDEHGLSARFHNIKVRQDFVKNRLAR